MHAPGSDKTFVGVQFQVASCQVLGCLHDALPTASCDPLINQHLPFQTVCSNLFYDLVAWVF